MSEIKKKRITEDSTNYWEQLERLDRLIRAAEIKAGLIFSFHSLFIGVVIDKIANVSLFMEGSLLYAGMVCLWFALVIVSLFFALRCFRPQMEMNFDTNAFFFIDANRNYGDVKGFRDAYRDINQDPDKLYGQLAEQIYVHSKIIDFKFATVQKSLKFLSLSFFWLLILIIVSLLNF
ncbi:Pycsar system effector family protein [Roseivirga sp.]|uniref:Pycsar system effector family protein n=1 Tax=Roseivirga sp. TaxID=1964215 RepID=UPI002B26B00C|nr:Pycsar system effector family protein [Roseivirga sp.]